MEAKALTKYLKQTLKKTFLDIPVDDLLPSVAVELQQI